MLTIWNGSVLYKYVLYVKIQFEHVKKTLRPTISQILLYNEVTAVCFKDHKEL